MHEIHDRETLLDHAGRFRHLRGVVVQGVDLTSCDARLDPCDLSGAVFLGCALPPRLLARAQAADALVFPRLPDLPFEPYRGRLYTPDELYRGHERGRGRGFLESDTVDARIYAHYASHRASPPLVVALAQRLHDHAIDDALTDWLGAADRRVVAIMGGHGLSRGAPAYRGVARMAKALAERGYLLASGGGPGAMEATHLGAWFAGAAAADLKRAIDHLATAPTYTADAWLDTALEARDRRPAGAESLAIPTWFYGHEPTSAFATHVAKYFSNSLREDGLLAVAKHGVVFAEGRAGTVQEIFQDACQNHYVTAGVASPMVFYGVRYWTRELPALPLLASLSRGRLYERMIAASDDEDAIVRFIVEHPPVAPAAS
jgi:predicted Rossmann-fold nucleotide-binding protein